MYQNATVAGTAASTGVLASTGAAADLLLLFLAGFALLALGLAVLRIVPRHEG